MNDFKTALAHTYLIVNRMDEVIRYNEETFEIYKTVKLWKQN